MRPARVSLGDVGSTNDEARTRFAGSPLWVTAARQLAGRGRRGRAWVSEAGNLYASHAFGCDWPPSVVGILPLAASLALADAIVSLGARPALKWPNDVLIDGKKVSGILIETAWTGEGRTTVIGFGVNVATAPTDMPATALSHHTEATAEALFAALAESLPLRLQQLEAGLVAAVREDWLALAVGVGDPVTVRLESQTLEGRFLGLDADGQLLLDADGGVRRIAAGDVFIRAVGA